MPIVLALDQGTTTGWAVGDTDTGAIVASGIAQFRKTRNETAFMRYLRFRKWLRARIVEHAPTLVVYESPQVRHRSMKSAEMSYKLEMLIELACYDRHLNYFSVHPLALKRHAVGDGHAPKERMLEEAERRWPKIKFRSHDQADALWILYYAATAEDV